MFGDSSAYLLGADPSKAAFQSQVIHPVDRMNLDAMAFVVLEHIERHIRAGGALGPDLAVKVGQAFRRFAVDADDNVAAPHPGFFGGTVGGDAAYHQMPADVVGGRGKPWG